MAYEYRSKQTVQFADTDMAGIVHFSNYFRYMESAEHGFYRSIGFGMDSSAALRTVGLPRIQVSCQYRSPLFFPDEVETQLLVGAISEKTITYVFLLRRCLEDSAPIVARGEVTIVCVAAENGPASMRSVPIPDDLRSAIEVAPQHLLDA